MVFALVALALVAGCSGTAQQTDEMGGVGPVSSLAPSPSPTVFQRLGYRFAVPEGWYASEGSRPWEGVGDPPLRSAAPFDTFVSPEVFPWIVIGKRPLTTKVSPDQWIEQLIADRAITYQPEQCNPVEDERPASLGGEPARMRAFHCPIDGPKAIGVQILATHDMDGWVVMCLSEKGNPGPIASVEQQCQRWLSSFQVPA
jgi:hypothetical protein